MLGRHVLRVMAILSLYVANPEPVHTLKNPPAGACSIFHRSYVFFTVLLIHDLHMIEFP